MKIIFINWINKKKKWYNVSKRKKKELDLTSFRWYCNKIPSNLFQLTTLQLHNLSLQIRSTTSPFAYSLWISWKFSIKPFEKCQLFLLYLFAFNFFIFFFKMIKFNIYFIICDYLIAFVKTESERWIWRCLRFPKSNRRWNSNCCYYLRDFCW